MTRPTDPLCRHDRGVFNEQPTPQPPTFPQSKRPKFFLHWAEKKGKKETHNFLNKVSLSGDFYLCGGISSDSLINHFPRYPQSLISTLDLYRHGQRPSGSTSAESEDTLGPLEGFWSKLSESVSREQTPAQEVDGTFTFALKCHIRWKKYFTAAEMKLATLSCQPVLIYWSDTEV